MRSPQLGWYGPDSYFYDKELDILKHVEYVDFKRYLADEDWAWVEIPHIVEIKDKQEKLKILAEKPYLLE